MGIISKTTGKLVLIAITSAITTFTLSGCFILTEDELEISLRGLLRIQDGLTEGQVRWILLAETFLIIFLILLVILIIAVFRRYRRVARRALEAKMRERRLMEENQMLNRLNSAKTEFLQNMSHDFKTPLTVISTSVLNAMDMLDYEYDKEELRESLSLAQSEIKRVSRTLDSAIRETALQSDRPSTEQINLARFLRHIEKTYRIYLSKHGNTLRIKMPKTLPDVHCSADTLQNIFSNLISNANRYTRKGVITISAEMTEEDPAQARSSRFITLAVRDSGMGVDPEILPDIFKRGVSKNKSGLGLPICKTAIESFGGTIAINSVYGKGTKVTFTVPVYEETKTGKEES